MTYQKLLTEIGQLPLDERLALLAALTHSLRTEMRPALCWLLASSGGTRVQHALGAGIRATSPRYKSDGDR